MRALGANCISEHKIIFEKLFTLPLLSLSLIISSETDFIQLLNWFYTALYLLLPSATLHFTLFCATYTLMFSQLSILVQLLYISWNRVFYCLNIFPVVSSNSGTFSGIRFVFISLVTCFGITRVISYNFLNFCILQILECGKLLFRLTQIIIQKD